MNFPILRSTRSAAASAALLRFAGAASAQTGNTPAACSQVPAGVVFPARPASSCVPAVDIGDALGKSGRRGEAFAWYLVAAHSGEARAQAWVGGALRTGGLTSDGIPVSRPHAAYWLNRAAKGGNAEAARQFAEMYRETADAPN